MPSPFHGIELASRALRAFQRGLDVTGHNLANVNTRGYSRQAVDFVQTDPTTFQGVRPVTLGTGVSISSVNRIRDIFLDNRMIDASADQGRFSTLSANLSQVEPLFNEPGSNGISSALTAFFNAWSGLASNPNEPAARMAVQQAGDTLATRIRTAYRDLQGLQNQLDGGMSETLTDIDRLSARIYELNSEIRRRTVAGESPGDLLDQRDLALDDLSQLADISIVRKGDGTVGVAMNSLTLVDDVGSYAIPKTFDPATYTVTNGTHTYRIDSGRMYGLMEASNRVTSYMGELDTLANSLRTEINTAHMSGTNANGATGIRFFNDTLAPPQNGAIDFNLSVEVRADFRNIAAGATGSAGDGGLALAISQLRDQPSSLLGSKKFTDFFSEILSGIGRDALDAKTNMETQGSIVNQIDMQRQSISGVSIDEEMANMLRLQRSFQAAAKALSIFDEVTEELISMVR